MTTTNLAIHAETARDLTKPVPRAGPISIRPATERDLKFIDALQKKHSKAVAFARHKELRSYIEQGQTALIAEECSPLPVGEGLGVRADTAVGDDRAHPHPSPLPRGEGVKRPIGYCLYRDRYMKREDCGNIVQLAVDSSKHRGLVGAAIIQAMFERVPYGVRLFCCWCAQDLEANRFWEALGFVPLAYRAGSRGKEHGGRRSGGTRLQIFWQRRVREGDGYPYWYPSLTSNGRMNESRIVLPIPPDKHWSEELPMVLPGIGPVENAPALPGEKQTRKRTAAAKPKMLAPGRSFGSGGLRFAPPPGSPDAIEAKPAKPKREKQPPRKNDPKHIAAAREWRDRYLEQVNAGLILPEGNGKYDVSRQLPPIAAPMALKPMPAPHLLNAA